MRNFITIFAVFTLAISLSSCDHMGTTRVKNLIDLTPHLETEEDNALNFSDIDKKPLSINDTRSGHKITKYSIITQPAIAKQVMYFLDSAGYVTAFSLKEKRILWVTDITQNNRKRSISPDGGILFSNGKLYVANGSRYLTILDSTTGHSIMQKEFPDILRTKPIMATDKILIVQTASNQTVAYDVESSKFLWSHEGIAETISSKNRANPILHNKHVLVSYNSGDLLYIDITNGKVKWSYQISANEIGLPNLDPSLLVVTPIIRNNYAYFATSNNKVVKLDLDNGMPAWVKKIDDIQSMSVIGESIFVTTNARQIAALATHNGKVEWVGNLISDKDRSAKKPQATSFQSPFITGTNIDTNINVIASNGEFYQFDLDKTGHLPLSPKITKIKKDAKYYWVSCCTGKLHIVTDKMLSF
ncbi:PQQ-binding-like beta-propeller repeat protein [Rickettsiaceae bacterium]|nr:PQQ-binding-like beta-propeller repeat protein [Rickettsiaceae bacterium]